MSWLWLQTASTLAHKPAGCRDDRGWPFSELPVLLDGPVSMEEGQAGEGPLAKGAGSLGLE